MELNEVQGKVKSSNGVTSVPIVLEPSATGPCIDTDQDVIVHDSAEDVILRYSQRKKRSDTLLFRIIRGGNAQLVRKTLDHLRARNLKNELNWVLGLKKPPPKVLRSKSMVLQILKMVPRLLVLLFTALTVIILTPLFYIFHAIGQAFVVSFDRRISKDVDLPLAFAVFSKNEHMVQLFTEMGVELDEVDHDGNNVFHYLSDLSVHDFSKATDCLDLIQRLFPVQKIRAVLLDLENHKGLSAFETIASSGSIRLLRKVSEIEGIIQRTVISVSDDCAWMRSREIADEDVRTMSEQGENFVRVLNAEEEVGYRVCRYDVTNFEQGDILCKQSFLLRLLVQRQYVAMDEVEVDALVSCEWIQKWSALKISSTKYMYWLARVEFLLQCGLFVYYMTITGGDHQITPLAEIFIQNFAQTFIQKVALANNETMEEVQADATVELSDILNFRPGSNQGRKSADHFLSHCNPNSTVVGDNNIVLDECGSLAFSMLSERCEDLSENDIVKFTGLDEALLAEDFRKSFSVSSLLAICYLVHVIFDLSFRLLCLFRSFPLNHGSFLQGLTAYLSCRIPGSYVEKQLGLLISLNFLSFYVIQSQTYASSDLQWVLEMEYVMRTKMVVSMILIFFNLIYILRLLPVIGLFIMTSVKLLRNLIEFLLVYCIVSFGFSVMFYFLLRDTTCPANRLPGYQDVFGTLYNVYLAMLGQGNFPTDYDNLVKLGYFTYSVISVVMLLNLIIAIMGTTTDRVMVAPWNKVLHDMDRLSVALHQESKKQTILWPIRKFCKKLRKKAEGYVHFDVGGHNKVYVEVEYDK